MIDQASLRDLLEREGIRRDSYAIGRGHFPSEAFVLYFDRVWTIAYAERGQENPCLTFATEAEACRWLAHEMLTHSLACWFFVADGQTEEQADRAFARWVAEANLPPPTSSETMRWDGWDFEPFHRRYIHGKYVRRHHLTEWGPRYLQPLH